VSRSPANESLSYGAVTASNSEEETGIRVGTDRAGIMVKKKRVGTDRTGIVVEEKYSED
jgi:hypothetical protein